MAEVIYCPTCSQGYELSAAVAGRLIQCSRCNQVFQAPAMPTPTAPAMMPRPYPQQSPYPQQGAMPGPVDLEAVSQAMGAAAGPAPVPLGPSPLSTPSPLGAVGSKRYRRMSQNERQLLGIGAGLAGLALACLLIVFPFLGGVNAVLAVLMLVVGLGGAGLVFVGAKSRMAVAGGAAGGVAVLSLLGVTLSIGSSGGSWPAADGPVPEDGFGQMVKMLELLESIQDEPSLKVARPKVLYLFSKMLQTESQAQGDEKVRQALPEFCLRAQQAARRVGQVDGGAAMLAEIQRKMAAGRSVGRLPTPQAPRLSPATRNALVALGLAVHGFHDAHRKAPADWNELESFLASSPSELATVRKLHAEGVVAQWGVSFIQATCGSSNFVLAYEREAANTGGGVLMLDGSVSLVTASELRQMLARQAPVVQAATGALPASPSSGDAGADTPLTLTAWVSWGWSSPLPPEPSQNHPSRAAAVQKAGYQGEDTVIVVVEGIPDEQVAGRVRGRIASASGGVCMSAPEPKAGKWEFSTRADDIRRFAWQLNVGPIVKFDEARGTVTVRLDPSRLADCTVHSLGHFLPAASPSSQLASSAAATSPPVLATNTRLPSATTQPAPTATQPAPAATQPAPSDASPFEPVPSTTQPSPQVPAGESPFEPVPSTPQPTPTPAGRMGPRAVPPGPGFFPQPVGPAGRGGGSQRRSKLVGGVKEGGPYESVCPGPVAVIAYQTGSWKDEPGFMFLQLMPAGGIAPGLPTVTAKPGYAMGGIKVSRGSHIGAMQIVWMKLGADGRLDPKDSYTSDWIGTSKGETDTILSDGPPVVGVYGQRMLLLHCIGLIFAQ